MGTFRGLRALVGEVLAMTTVFLGEAEKSVNGLLVCGVCQYEDTYCVG